METVEILKRQNADLKRRNRLAVAIAAACGFVAGIVMTLLSPLVGNLLPSFSVSLTHLYMGGGTAGFSFAVWIVMAGVCVITALNAYEIALAKLPPESR